MALDISRPQIERGRLRARSERRSVSSIEGDAQRLPFADEHFDRVLNSFGDVIVVEEMLRVARQGGVVGISEFTGEGFAGDFEDLLDILTSDTDAGSTGLGSAGPRWGQEEHVRTVLAPLAHVAEVRRVVTPARFESVDRFCDELLRRDPDLNHARLSPERRKEFSGELRRVTTAWNADRDGGLVLELVWLLAVATKPRSRPSPRLAERADPGLS